MEIKFNCSNSACRQRISVDESLAGKSFSCPACGTAQQVPISKNIKFNCSNPECGQHIVVDVSETGRYVKCPACDKPLQVPGPPPKPFVSAPVEKEKQISPPPPNTPKKPRPISPLMRLAYGWGIGATLFGLLIGGFYLRAWAVMPKHLEAMSDEIFADGRIWDAPLENHDGSMMLYAQDTQDGIAQEFTVQGNIVYTVFNPKNEVWAQDHKNFIIKRNDDKWLIRTWDENTNDNPNSIDLYQEAGCDGTNIFWVTVQNTNKISKNISVSALGNVTDGIVPRFDKNVTLVSPIWLAYASLPYFKTIKNGKVKHIEYVSDEIFETESVQAEWQINSNAPDFIQSATYHDNGMTEEHLPTGETKPIQWPKPFDHGFVSAVFTVNYYTNIDSFSVPANFSISFFKPSYGPTNGLRTAVKIDGTLNNFRLGVDNQSFYPKIMRKMILTDERFHVKEFNYVLTNGEVWLQKGDSKLNKFLNYYNRNYAQSLSKQPPNPTSKRFFVILFIAVNIVLFGFIFRRLKPNK